MCYLSLSHLNGFISVLIPDSLSPVDVSIAPLFVTETVFYKYLANHNNNFYCTRHYTRHIQLHIQLFGQGPKTQKICMMMDHRCNPQLKSISYNFIQRLTLLCGLLIE